MLIGIAVILAFELLISLSAIDDLHVAIIGTIDFIGNILGSIVAFVIAAIATVVTLGSLYYSICRFMDTAYGHNSLTHKYGHDEEQPELDNFIKGIVGLVIPIIALVIAASIDIPMMMAGKYQLALVGFVYLITTIFAMSSSLRTYRDPKRIAYLEKFEKGYYHDRVLG